MDCSPPGFSVHGDSPGKDTGVGCYALLQGIFPTQGLNPGLPHCRWILYYLSHQGSPRILKWVAYPFSRGSSWPRNWTGVSWNAGGFFTSWASIKVLKHVFVAISSTSDFFPALGETETRWTTKTVLLWIWHHNLWVSQWDKNDLTLMATDRDTNGNCLVSLSCMRGWQKEGDC